MDEKSKAIDIIRSDIADKQEQIKYIEELDVTRPVTEEQWTYICRTPLRTSNILIDIIKAIFPDSEKAELHEEVVEFCLHGFDCYISTVGRHGIGIDMSWYKYIRHMGSFADEMDQECSRIIEYLNIKEPTVYDRVDFVYPIKPGHRKVFYYSKAEKDKLWKDNKEEIINRTDPERLQRILTIKEIQFEKKAVENEIERRVQQRKITTLTDDVLPYLHRFTDNVHSYGTDISIEQILIDNSLKIL